MTLSIDSDEGPVFDAVSCAYCGTIFDARGMLPNRHGEHSCPICCGENRAYKPRFLEMDVYEEEE